MSDIAPLLSSEADRRFDLGEVSFTTESIFPRVSPPKQGGTIKRAGPAQQRDDEMADLAEHRGPTTGNSTTDRRLEGIHVPGKSLDLTCVKDALAVPFKNESMWQPISTAPFDRDLELAVMDGDGVHALVFPCRRILTGWTKSATKERVDISPTHWRTWEPSSKDV